MHFLSSKVCLWYINIDLKVTGNGDFAKFCRNYCDSRPQISLTSHPTLIVHTGKNQRISEFRGLSRRNYKSLRII